MKLLTVVIPLSGVVLLSSCATIFNKRTHKFDIRYAQENTKLLYKDSIYQQPASIRVVRSSKPLELTFFNDSVTRHYLIRRNVNPMFAFTNFAALAGGPAVLLSYGIDLTNPKRFHYGSGLLVKLDDTTTINRKSGITGTLAEPKAKPTREQIIQREQKEREQKLEARQQKREQVAAYFSNSFSKKGQTYVLFSSPISFYLVSNPEVGIKTNGGFLACLNISVDHYYADRKAWGITGGFSLAFPKKVRDSLFGTKYIPYRENLTYYHLGAYRKIEGRRSSFSYGLNYAYTRWRSHYDFYSDYYGTGLNDISLNEDLIQNSVKANHSIGFLFGIHYHFKPYMDLGVVYMPTVLRIAPDLKGIYQHNISIDVAFRLKDLHH